MKRIIFITFAIAFATMTMNAQPAARLIKKYSKVEGAEYIDAVKMLKDGKFQPNEKGNYDINIGIMDMKDLEMPEFVLDYKILSISNCKPTVAEKLKKDVKALKGYSVMNHNDEGGSYLRMMMKMDEAKGDTIMDAMLICISMPEQADEGISAGMIYAKAKKMPGDDWFSDDGDDEEDEDDEDDEDKEISMNDVLYRPDFQDPLIVIDGQIHPELHTYKDIDEYYAKQEDFINHKISYLYDGALFGSQVKEKYPNSTKNIALIYKTVEQNY